MYIEVNKGVEFTMDQYIFYSVIMFLALMGLSSAAVAHAWLWLGFFVILGATAMTLRDQKTG